MEAWKASVRGKAVVSNLLPCGFPLMPLKLLEEHGGPWEGRAELRRAGSRITCSIGPTTAPRSLPGRGIMPRSCERARYAQVRAPHAAFGLLHRAQPLALVLRPEKDRATHRY